jgi:hypothetical protein
MIKKQIQDETFSSSLRPAYCHNTDIPWNRPDYFQSFIIQLEGAQIFGNTQQLKWI